jgi:hypothetical protein
MKVKVYLYKKRKELRYMKNLNELIVIFKYY